MRLLKNGDMTCKVKGKEYYIPRAIVSAANKFTVREFVTLLAELIVDGDLEEYDHGAP